MHLDLDALSPAERYKLLSATVIPRPVAWVTTVNGAGLVNAAPYSFFNVFSEDPALVILGLQARADGSPKDTTRNVREMGEFVVNLATPDLAERMVATAAGYDAAISEPEALGLALAASAKVAPPRLADAPVAIECVREVALAFGPRREILIGRAVGLAARDGMIDDRLRVHWDDYPVARLFGDRYGRIEEIAPLRIPEVGT